MPFSEREAFHSDTVSQRQGAGARLLCMRTPLWSSLLLACALSACDVGPGGPLGVGANNGGFVIGGTGGGSGADTLSFSVQPSSATAGNIITPAIQVIVRDSVGNPDSSFTTAITITIGVNPSGGTLSGTASVAPVNGIAQFGDLSIDKAGTGYGLRASAAGAVGASSNTFDITP
jgi:hypothetical protein